MTETTYGDLETLTRVRGLVASGAARSLRRSAGLTVKEVAQASGVNWRTIYRYEGAEVVPRGQAALRYGRLLEHLLGERP